MLSETVVRTHLQTKEFYVSKSRILTYLKACERKYYYGYVMGIRRFDVNAWNYLGSLKHEIFYGVLARMGAIDEYFTNEHDIVEDYSCYKTAKKFLRVFGNKVLAVEENHARKIGDISIDGVKYAVNINTFIDVRTPSMVIDLKSKLTDRSVAELEARFYTFSCALFGHKVEGAATFSISAGDYWVYDYDPLSIEDIFAFARTIISYGDTVECFDRNKDHCKYCIYYQKECKEE